MAGERSRSLRLYIRRRKAEIRRESGNPEPAIEALLRQFPQPTRADQGRPPPASPTRTS